MPVASLGFICLFSLAVRLLSTDFLAGAGAVRTWLLVWVWASGIGRAGSHWSARSRLDLYTRNRHTYFEFVL
jgi:hypothetical protein